MPQPCETCPACGRSTSYTGALGCLSEAAPCHDAWHCRLPRHQALAHLRRPALDAEAASGNRME